MSKEQYTPPTASQAGLNPTRSAYTIVDDNLPTTQYLCGECNAKVMIKKGEPIRCRECGHRILYKERTKRMVQFEAR
ncbi:DNA-directed RNA polymerase core subunit rpc10 [Lambiella insularis]|nr:DNA-directed RNA polymerase core subunit rpc10 [Lambiella insularis]